MANHTELFNIFSDNYFFFFQLLMWLLGVVKSSYNDEIVLLTTQIFS